MAGKKRRTKTFTGCWTCRARHVKCDERRPLCLRCTNAKIDCEGYEVRLSWASTRSPVMRRHIVTGDRHSNSESRTQHASASANIETIEQPEDVTTDFERTSHGSLAPLDHGFNSTSTERIAQNSQGPAAHEQRDFFFLSAGDPSQNSSAGDHLSGNTQHTSSDLEEDQINITYGPFIHEPSIGDTDQPTIWAGVLPESGSNRRQNRSHNDGYEAQLLSCDNQTAGNGDFGRIRHTPILSLPSPSSVSTGLELTRTHLQLLPDSSQQRDILEYWSVYLCDTILPVPGPRNPLREVFMPIALQGAQSSSKTSTAATALFHLICAVSAFQLSRIKSNGDERQRLASLALAHHNSALAHLRRNLLSSQPHEYIPVLAALNMCILNETITAGDPSWRVHMQGACHWVRNVDPDFWSQSRSASILYQMFVGLAILSLSPLVLDGDRDAAESFIDFQHPRELYCLDRVYGLPFSTLKAVSGLNKLQEDGLISPEGATTECTQTARKLDLLEMEMFLSVPDVSTLEDDRDQKGLLFHLNYASYYASLIYFKRTIRKIPVAEVQSLVERGLEQLEAAISCTSRIFSPLIWSAAVPAFEAADPSLRKRFLKFISDLYRKSSFEVWKDFRTLTTRLWAARDNDDGDENLPWQEFLRQVPELRIMMV